MALRMGQLEDSSLTARRVASAPHVVVGTPTYFARTGEPTTPGDLAAHEAVIYDQEGGGADWTFQRDSAEIAVTLKGRLRVSAAEGVRAAALANAGIAIVSEWMFAPEIRGWHGEGCFTGLGIAPDRSLGRIPGRPNSDH